MLLLVFHKVLKNRQRLAQSFVFKCYCLNSGTNNHLAQVSFPVVFNEEVAIFAANWLSTIVKLGGKYSHEQRVLIDKNICTNFDGSIQHRWFCGVVLDESIYEKPLVFNRLISHANQCKKLALCKVFFQAKEKLPLLNPSNIGSEHFLIKLLSF